MTTAGSSEIFAEIPPVRRGPEQSATRPEPTGWARMRLRLAFKRRIVLERCRRAGGRVWPLPWVGGLVRLWIARREVLAALRDGEMNETAPPADHLLPTDLPSGLGLARTGQVIAELDQDGFARVVNPADRPLFNCRDGGLPRVRYQLDVVVQDGAICVRKEFRRQPLSRGRGIRAWLWSVLGRSFYTEAAALLRLRGLPSVPQIRKIDTRRRAIYMDYIRGESLRHKLANEARPVHDRDLAADPELRQLTGQEREDREITFFGAVATPELRESIKSVSHQIACRGVLPLDVKPGNLIVGRNTGNLYWVDFEYAHLGSWSGWRDALDQHRRLLNRWFGVDMVTRERVRTFHWAGDDGDVYSPVDFGELGWVGDIADVERGEGRWRWLLAHQANWQGKRILDLGSNNCLYAVRELQQGAREVHCVEMNPEACGAARLIAQTVEQAQSRPLPLHIHNCDIHSFLVRSDFPPGYFDITMALCSIYYLSREQIAESLEIIASISNECWLQANNHTPRDDAGLFTRASQQFLEDQLREAGFTDVTVIAPDCYWRKPRQYRRPLLIGRKPATGA